MQVPRAHPPGSSGLVGDAATHGPAIEGLLSLTHTGFNVGLFFFSLHLLLNGVVVLKAPRVPNVLGCCYCSPAWGTSSTAARCC